MAVLSKIRERSMFLIIIIGLALFAFVLDPSTLGDFFNSTKINEIGEVNGETISRQEFANELEAYRQQTGGRVSEIQAANSVWDNIIRQKIYKNQLEEAGITIGEADVWNEIVSAPFVQQSPNYQNEAGLFDENKFKQFLADTKENDPQLWAQWSNYMNQVRDNFERNTYNNLVTAGLGASLKEGEYAYKIENTKLTAQYVYVPYSTIADSLVKIKKSEIESYINANPGKFQVEDTRDISFVQFKIEPTEEDRNAIKTEVGDYAEDLKATQDYPLFLSENDADTNLNTNYQFKSNLNQAVAEMIYEANEGDVVGPYEDRGLFKISKVTEVVQMPDSARASHILIPYAGAQRAADVTRTKEEAQKLADSLFRVVKRNRSKFNALAEEFSSDKGSAAKGGDLDWFNYNTMTPAFRDFSFTNSKGSMDVVETPFGFHVIRIDDQKNKQKVIKLATFGKNIVPSEATENRVYQKAQEFALALTNGEGSFFEVAKEKGYKTQPAVGLASMAEMVPTLGAQRQIVSWAHNSETSIGDFRRFDLEGSHVVASVTDAASKGLMSVEKAVGRVRPILVKEKKAEMIKDKLSGSDLQDIAKSNSTSVRTATNITFNTPTISGVGVEPKIVGAMYESELNKLYAPIIGERGVFAFIVNKKEMPTELPNYDANRKRISEERKRATFKMYEAIKKASDINDNRAVMYGGN